MRDRRIAIAALRSAVARKREIAASDWDAINKNEEMESQYDYDTELCPLPYVVVTD